MQMTDYDATAHITEGISNPEKKAPWAISMAMLFTWLAGFVYNIVLCFVTGDMASISKARYNLLHRYSIMCWAQAEGSSTLFAHSS